MNNIELAQQQGNQAAPNVIDAAKASEVQIDITLAQEQGNQAAPLIADSFVGSESYDAIKQQGTQAMPLIVDALEQPVPPVPPTPTVDYMYFEAVQANSTVALMSMLETAPNLEYSTDGTTWQDWQHTTADGAHTFDTITLTAVGDRVYLRGVNPDGFLDFENQKLSLFSMTGKIAAGGNAQSLVDGDTPTLVAKSMPLFSNYGMTQQPSDVLTQAPALPATTLADYCYAEMLTGCTGLTQAPALPATTLADGCYAGMFDGCTGLTQAPALPATTLADKCYSGMFRGCTSLTAAADMPALTTIGDGGCAYMYAGCTSLTSAAAMPALTTIGDEGCSDMYHGCTSLNAAADMPSLTTIGEYGCYDMYSSCTSLTVAADMPSLTTIFDGGCEAMYDVCTFEMSDDGTTLNFAFPTPPITTTGENQTTYATAYDVANWMFNTNGFTNP